MSNLSTVRASHVRIRGSIFSTCFAAIALSVATLGLAGSQARAADAATGTIEGRVLNQTNGRYLGKAVVKVEGTTIETLTNEFGEYTLREIPEGTVKITVSYTGQDNKTVDVSVAAGKTTNQDVGLSHGRTAPVVENGTLVLDPYIVEQQRFRNAQEIAANEERNSITPKNVVSADMFGDIAEGNIGEFVKFLPGVLVEYGGTAYSNPYDATGISIRGFGAEDTAITLDGVPIANASPASLSRQVGLDMMSINNASRVEIIKVPTPDMPANSMGGAVNLISKTAFEYSRPTVSWRVYGTFDSTVPLSLHKTPGPSRDRTIKLQPGAELTLALPLTKSFGVSLTASSANQYNTLKRAESTWSSSRFNLAGDKPWTDADPVGVTGPDITRSTLSAIFPLIYGTNSSGDVADMTHPALTKIQITDNPRMTNRNSGSVKLDWKPFKGSVLTGMYQVSKYDSVDVSHRVSFGASKPKDWSPTFTDGLQWRADRYGRIQPYVYVNPTGIISATSPATGTMVTPVAAWATGSNGGRIKGDQGGNAVDQTIDARDREGLTNTGSLSYNFTRGPWKIIVMGSQSNSDGKAVDVQNGHFSKVEMKMDPGLVNFRNIQNGVPGSVEVYRRPTTAETPLATLPFATQDAAYNAFYSNPANLVDYTKLSNWVTNNFKGFSADSYSKSKIGMYKIDVSRELDFLPFSQYVNFSLKLGSRRDIQEEKKYGRGTGFRRSLKSGAPTLASWEYIDTGYINQNPGFGFPPMEWADTYKMYQLDQERGLFRPTEDVYSENRAGWDTLANADLTTTNQDARDNYGSWVNQQKRIKETKTGYYVQLEGRAFNNRLSFVGGSRREDAKREGYQPWTDTKWNFVRNPDGSVFKETIGTVVYDRGVSINNAYNALDPRTNLFAPDLPLTGTPTAAQILAVANRDALKARLNQLGASYPGVVIPTASLAGILRRLNPEHGIYASAKGKANYSASFAFKVTDEVTARLSWSRSFGQIKLEDSTGGLISGSASTLSMEQYDLPGNPDETISLTEYREFVYNSRGERGLAVGTFKLGNPNLKPWVSDNFDLSVSYDHRFDGKLTISGYQKTVKNIQNNLIIYEEMAAYKEILASVGIDFDINDPNDSYHNWKIESTVNGPGVAKTQGLEIDLQQRFGFLGNWGKYFSLFASYTKKKTDNPEVRTLPHPLTGLPITVTSNQISKSANKSSGFGLMFSNGRLTASVKGTFRENAYADSTGSAYYQGATVKLYDHYPKELRLDTSASYALSPKYSVFVNARDILNSERKTVRYDEQGLYPEYARQRDIKQFGVQVNCGIRGEF